MAFLDGIGVERIKRRTGKISMLSPAADRRRTLGRRAEGLRRYLQIVAKRTDWGEVDPERVRCYAQRLLSRTEEELAAI
jgi:hypothetical protein